ASRAPTKARATKYSAGTESAATKTDAAFHAGHETCSGGENDAAFESVNSAGAESAAAKTDAAFHTAHETCSGDKADDAYESLNSACAGPRTQARRCAPKPGTDSK